MSKKIGTYILLPALILNTMLRETLKRKKAEVKFKISNMLSFLRELPLKIKLYFLFIGLLFFGCFRLYGFAERILLISACDSCGVPVVFTR